MQMLYGFNAIAASYLAYSLNQLKTSQNKLKTEIKTSQNKLETQMKTSLYRLETEMKTSQNRLETEMKTSQNRLETEMKTSQNRLETQLNEMKTQQIEMKTQFKKMEEKIEASQEEMKNFLFGDIQAQLAKESIINIDTNDGYIHCMGNIVKLGSNYFVSTAKHCADSKRLNGIPLFSNGSYQISAEDHFYKHDTHDLALIPILQEKNPNLNMSKIAAHVSEKPAEIFQKLRGISYSDGKLRGFSGEVVYPKNHENQLQIETKAKQGDSGAGLFYGKKLKAILSGSMQMNQDDLSFEYEDIFQKMKEQEQTKGKFKNLLKNDLQQMNRFQKRDIKEYIDKKRDVHRNIFENFFVVAESAHYLHEIPINQEQAKSYF